MAQHFIEYTQALRSKYFRLSRQDKGKMLDEFTQVTGLHGKASIRLLNRPGQPKTNSDMVGHVNTVQKLAER